MLPSFAPLHTIARAIVVQQPTRTDRPKLTKGPHAGSPLSETHHKWKEDQALIDWGPYRIYPTHWEILRSPIMIRACSPYWYQQRQNSVICCSCLKVNLKARFCYTFTISLLSWSRCTRVAFCPMGDLFGCRARQNYWNNTGYRVESFCSSVPVPNCRAY